MAANISSSSLIFNKLHELKIYKLKIKYYKTQLMKKWYNVF